MKKIFFLLIGLIFFSKTNAQLTLSPEKNTGTYQDGETPKFVVSGVTGTLSYDLFFDPALYSSTNNATKIGSGTMSSNGFINVPTSIGNGFVFCKVLQGTTSLTSVLGYNVAKIASKETIPTDFDSFWINAVNDSKKFSNGAVNLPYDESFTQVASNTNFTTYRFSLRFRNNLDDNAKLNGIITIPTSATSITYPTIIKLPAYTSDPINDNTITGDSRYVYINLSVHNIPSSFAGSNNGAHLQITPTQNNNKNDIYFKHIILGTMRLIQFLTEKSTFNLAGTNTALKVDNTKLSVCGESQGGLSLIVGGLDHLIGSKKIKAIVTSKPGFGELQIPESANSPRRATGFPRRYTSWLPNPTLTPSNLESAYFNAPYFLRNYTGPVSCDLGYKDDVCPAATNMVSLNSLSDKVVIVNNIATDHSGHGEFYTNYQNFISNFTPITGLTNPYPLVDAGIDMSVNVNTSVNFTGVVPTATTSNIFQNYKWEIVKCISGNCLSSNVSNTTMGNSQNTAYTFLQTGKYLIRFSMDDVKRLSAENIFLTLRDHLIVDVTGTTTSQSNLTLLATPVPTVTPSSIPTSTTATNVTLGFTIQNTGTLAGSSTVTYFLSNDNIYDASDLALSGATTSSTASLNPNATQAISTPISIPANTQVGVKYVIVRLANGNNVPIQLTVTAPIGGSCPITFQSFTQNTNAVSGCAANPRTYVLSFKANSTTNPSAPSNIIYAVNLPTSQPLTPLTTSALPVSAAGTAIIDYPQATGGVRTMAWTLPTQLVNGTVYTCQFSFCYVDASTAPTNTPKATYTNSTCTPNPQEIFLGASNPCTNDVTLPVISGCPANISLSAAGVATWTAPTPTDNCAVTSFTSNYTSGSSFPVGVTTVTYTAKDAANNTATCSFTVTVSNTTCVPARLPINTAAFTFSVAPSGLSTSLLTDGQSTITSPPSGNVPNLSGSGWVGAWSNVLGSTELTLDGRYTITDIYAYDGNGTTEYAGNLKVNISYKKVGASVYETLTKDIALTGYNVWSSQTNLGWNDVKYLKFTTQNDASNVNEIVIFGCKTGAARLSVNEDTPTETLFTIYPNPTNYKLTVEYSLTKDSEINFGIMDMTGKTLQNRTIEGKAGTHSFVMDVSKIIEGSYILRGITEDKSQAKKFVIIR
jgi:cephalosporin-C deacetylase-like acetyl esterase